MLTELIPARQVPGEGFRRWFTSPDMDLVVWYEDATCAGLVGFQLGYDRKELQHALTWRVEGGFTLNRVDEGDASYAAKMSPVLMPAKSFDGPVLLERFTRAAAGLEYGLVSLVREKIAEFSRLYAGRTGQSAPTGGHAAGTEQAGRFLLDALRDAFYGPALHGPALLPTLRGLSAEQLNWSAERDGRPMGAWQVALHAAFWKRAVSQRIREVFGLPEARRSHRFELEDWTPAVSPAPEDWADCLNALEQEHEALAEAAAALVRDHAASLPVVEAASGFTWAAYLYGMAAHDVYHTAHLRNLGIPGLPDA